MARSRRRRAARRELRDRGPYDHARTDIDAAQARLERDRDLERGRTERARPAPSHGLGR